jgi:KTSC domain
MRRCSPSALAVGLLLIAAIASGAPLTTPPNAGIITRIKRVPVESTALAAVGYSKRLRALEIEFRNGAIYRYLEVAPSVYRALMNSLSKARFYQENFEANIDLSP